MQVVVVGLTHGNFDKFQAVFTGVIQHVAHHFHKIILFADKADLRRDIETDIDPFALVNLVQRRGQLVEQRRNGVQFAAEQGTAAAHTGAMQVVANLL